MKKYAILFCLPLLFAAIPAMAQSELFGEAVNQDFTAKIQPGLLEQAANPETTPYDFMLICKRLGVYGEPAAAKVVAKWLGEPTKSHSARTALEEMPFEEALIELRAAVASVDDPVLKAGVIGSLGMRRDKKAVEIILPLLDSENGDVSEAAFFALARIADPSYRDKMTAKLANSEDNAANRVAADLLLMFGEFLRRDGHEEDALSVFGVVKEKAPSDFYREAAAFQILLRETDSTRKLAVEWLLGEEEAVRNGTLRAAAFVKSDGMTDSLLAAYAKASDAIKPAILAALGDQKNQKAQETLLAALASEDETIKTAAIGALRASGDSASLATLIETAVAGEEAIRREAVGVIELFDDSVDFTILKLLNGDDAHRAFGAELVGARKIEEGRPAVFEMAKTGPDSVKRVALSALGNVADIEALAFLTDTFASTSGETEKAALAGLFTACGTVSDKTASAEILASKADSLRDKPEKRAEIFKALSILGGPAAREAVERAAMDADAQSRDLATRTLGQWMDADVAPILLKLANTPDYPYQKRALRGYLRLARQFAMADWMRRAMVRDALASPVCQDEEKKIADIIVQQYRLDLNIPETDAQKILRNIEILRAVFGKMDDPAKQKDVTEKVRDFFFKSDKASAAFEGGYNKFFDGDPAPNVPKTLRLTIKYRDTGTVSDVDFSENAPVVLPVETK